MAYCSFFLFIVLRKLIVHFTIVGDTWPLSASTCYPFSFSSWASPAPPCSAACLGFKLDMLKPTEDYSSQQPLHLDETMWPRQGNVWKRRLARACSPEGRGLLSSALFCSLLSPPLLTGMGQQPTCHPGWVRGPHPEFVGPQTEGATLCLTINEASEH